MLQRFTSRLLLVEMSRVFIYPNLHIVQQFKVIVLVCDFKIARLDLLFKGSIVIIWQFRIWASDCILGNVGLGKIGCENLGGIAILNVHILLELFFKGRKCNYFAF